MALWIKVSALCSTGRVSFLGFQECGVEFAGYGLDYV